MCSVCVTSLFKNEHPRITVSQNAYGNRKPLRLCSLEQTPVPLFLRGENCAASLFVRFFTSMVMSTQIKMTVLYEGSEAQSCPHHLFHFMRKENARRAERLREYGSLSVRAHAYISIAGSLKWFLEWERKVWGLNFHSSFHWLSNLTFPPS